MKLDSHNHITHEIIEKLRTKYVDFYPGTCDYEFHDTACGVLVYSPENNNAAWYVDEIGCPVWEDCETREEFLELLERLGPPNKMAQPEMDLDEIHMAQELIRKVKEDVGS